MAWPNSDLQKWLSGGMITLQLTAHFSEPVLDDVMVIFACDYGLCIEWGRTERFIPWAHVQHMERSKGTLHAA